MTSSQVKGLEQTLWFNYYQQIAQQLIGTGNVKETLGDNGAIYVCPITTQGLAGGNWIPDEVTNNQLYRLADSMLPGDSPVYLPGGGSYSLALRQYLAWVQLNGNPSSANIIRLTEAIKRATQANNAFETEMEKAFDLFSKAPTATGLEFAVWARTYRPGYYAKLTEMTQANQAVNNINLEIYGNDSIVLGDAVSALTAAVTPSPASGLNMSCVREDLNNIQANLAAAQAGDTSAPVSKPTGSFFRPAYSIQGYKDIVNNWVNNFENQQPTTITFSSASSTSASWSDYNFQHINVSGGFASSWWLFSTRASYDSTSSSKHVSLNETSSSVTVTLTFKGLKTFDIGPGTWDLENPRKVFPNVRPGCPPEIISNLVKAERVLIGYGPGISVKLDATSYKSIHDAYQKSVNTSASARFNLFGFDLGASGSTTVQRTKTTTSTDVKWDSASSTVTILPQNDCYPALVGVLGRRQK